MRHDVSLTDPPRLTDAQKAELSALAARPDSEIGCSDIRPPSEAFWKNALVGQLCKPTKTSASVRIDSDVLAWLKARGYQSRINAILRREMISSIKREQLRPSARLQVG